MLAEEDRAFEASLKEELGLTDAALSLQLSTYGSEVLVKRTADRSSPEPGGPSAPATAAG
jgi:hypothetical protein